jgi:hypothetical protein
MPHSRLGLTNKVDRRCLEKEDYRRGGQTSKGSVDIYYKVSAQAR